MDLAALKETIQQELPNLLKTDPEVRDLVMDLTRDVYANRQDTDRRFWDTLAEMRRDREEQSRKWAEAKAESDKKWEEAKAESDKKWAEQNRKWDEQNRKWEESKAESDKKWDEQNRKWDENQRRFDQVHEAIMAQAKKFDRSIGGLGARWGLRSEKAFRDALAGILEENFGVEVINVNEFDDSGEVFGRPEQIELDIIIKNSLLLICELKSSIDKAGMYMFERKARYYEKRHQRKADGLLVISPMVDARAEKVARTLGIKVYGDSSEVELLE